MTHMILMLNLTLENETKIMKVYAVVASRVYSGEVLREPEGIYADEKRADAVCAELNAKAYRDEEYMVYDYEVQE